MNKYIERVVKHIDKFPITDRYDIERIYFFMNLKKNKKRLSLKNLLLRVWIR
jgi:hypothetical protein